MNPLLIQPASDHSILVSFGHRISRRAREKVQSFTARLLASRFDFIVNIHPAYASVLIAFDPFQISHPEVESHLLSLLNDPPAQTETAARTIEIPVCYGAAFGPDLEAVAAHHHLVPEEVVRLHAEGVYQVAFIGFTPGFPYLEGLSARLATPRLPSPRTRVPAGSVAIGGAQTGIYPIATPGGWRIIGRTPVDLFVPERTSPSLLSIGDHVRFRPVSRAEFDRLRERPLSESV